VAVGSTGLAGDEQADRVNHGGPYKAAYAYACEDVEVLGGADRAPARAGCARDWPSSTPRAPI
jgi:MOSC domain-containing protein YiiM